MNCRDSESLILAERDGALTQAQLAALSDHVATCPACAKLRANLTTALDAYQAGLATIAVPDADEAWRDLQAKLPGAGSKAARKRPLAPVIWFSAPLAAAAAFALAFFVSRPTPSTQPVEMAHTTPVYDTSIIAGADYVEAGDPNASTMVYVDKDSGWLVVWVTDSGTETSG
jgi:anti-sigma factor RsiW